MVESILSPGVVPSSSRDRHDLLAYKLETRGFWAKGNPVSYSGTRRRFGASLRAVLLVTGMDPDAVDGNPG